ncbi:Glycosyl transferase, WecB/TagA/CpsF family OS=Tsukamurella paurometabola (strain ATCC 8368 / DSM / CCUG 35730 / CIP 100753 / JCM 10117 / KCTC 9821 / NBRC 16120 / NCIMB 702349 / NCTC 13040) OX=521096 GN=Tpau_0063 PE=4 SV=1 [Tsukamurella paurometabola]|uniref:Glycosyl transferase, WecB/TagA/CpsF family n=1 Tax=Tsukamurella paurometabola (strain ATCC 8368 / DSM 20162 / CCUG 35730 / CIP 100753 / JCM 10117 / KCTC 9821 / NBRC 16120 / NCIMB 702349 / NCTC 13040) TaxID=521096 RepID=D5UPU9_TSUPD|nr:WecB/TagA/CpsF family glycosyltransferase [Tsukamurella paurometabola]ADG76717.1 glycosyl transferase, WecB/TagA/CpsF family [Tsukamurella paurometabola DSM 20162]SUP41339.1 Putative N-acetylmannosaminyltransferase [Tsukamurella paurometabola]
MTALTQRMLVAGTVITRLSHAEALDLVERRAAAPGRRPLGLCSANLDHFHHFRPGRNHLGSAVDWVTLADGAPVVRRGERLTGERWPRVTGADLLPDVIAVCAEHGFRIGFVGGTPEAHRALDATLRSTHPGLAIAGYWAPERDELEDPAANARLVAELRTAGVTVLVVGLGKPRQEQWIDTWGAETGAGVLLPFGAAADFIAGTVDRAPEAWQRADLEWLYRLKQEPRRLARRYLIQGPPALLRLRGARLVTSDATSARGDRP